MRVRFNLSSVLAAVFGLLLFTISVLPAHSQDIFGTINGTVTDKSGGVVANAKVIITNEATGLSQTIKANDRGYFVVESLPVGDYTVTVDQDKFKSTKKTGNTLVAGGHLTVNVTLEVGATAEVIEVTATGVAINTTSAEISRTIDAKEVITRALNERNYIELATLVPGAVLTSFDQTAFTTGMSIAPANINGVRTDANLLTVDGGFNMDSGSNGTQLNNVGLDFIQEVNVQTSNYSAEYGRSFGSSINVVTKSGGNKLHGTLFEYARNNDFDAKPAFSPKLELRYNDFGGSVGGYIIKKKLFFFGGVEAKRLVLPGDGPAKTLTLPTSPELVGNFADALTGSNILTARGTVTAASGCIGSYSGGASDVNPADFVPNTATGTGTAINPSCISSGGKAIANIYKMMETPGASPESANSFTNTAISGNATFAPVTPQNWSEYIARLDYHPTDAHTDYFRALYDHLILVDPFGPFSPGGALPTSPQLRIRPGYSFQVGDVWAVSSHLVNEAKFNVSWNKQRIPPTGNLWQQSTYGFTSANYVEPFPGVGPFPTGIPSGTYTGTCTITTACPAEFLGPFEFLLAPTVDISPSDNVSWQVRNHTIKFGVSYSRNRKDQNSRTDATQGQLNFSSSNTANTTGDQFADSLLGNYNSLTQFSADPIGHFRFNDYGSYIDDSWRVTRRLSIELGLRVDYTIPIYTQANNAVNFDPSLYVPIPGLTIGATSNIPTAPLSDGLVFDCPPTSTTPGACNPGAAGGGYVVTGLVRPGGVPADQLGRVPNGNSPFVLDVPAGAQRGFYKPEVTPAPRVGVAFTPFGDNTVIRAGAGMYFDRPEGNIIFGQTGIVPFLQQVQFNFGNIGALPATGAAPTVFGVSAINPNMVVARVVSYSLSIQHEFRGGIMVQAAYVGNEARHLIREPNINVPTFAAAGAAASGSTINQVRPFLGYGDISQFLSDGTSNYNSFQLSASKTKGFATFQVSYTYSNALGNANGLNDNPEPECAFTCRNASGQTVSWKQYDYGPLSFDIRNAFVASYTLNEPWFKNRKGVTGALISDWQLSGITRAQSGFPLTVNGSAALAASSGTIGGESFTDRANIVSGSAISPGITPCGVHLCYFNTAAFTSTGMTTGIGNAPIGNIVGPGYFSWDLSLRKNFRLPIESMGFMIELDAFNAFNRVNYTNPSVTVTSSSFAQVTGSQPPRQLQLGAKFTF